MSLVIGHYAYADENGDDADADIGADARGYDADVMLQYQKEKLPFGFPVVPEV